MESASMQYSYGFGDLAVKLLRLFPLITTTILLINRLAQYFALSTFLPPYTTSKTVGPVLQLWLRQVVKRIFPGVVVIVFVTRIALFANLFIRTDDFYGTHARKFHLAGVLFSFAHLAIAPKMLKLERKMQSEDLQPEEMIQLLSNWLKVNNVRMWLVDVPFWAIELGATIELFKI